MIKPEDHFWHYLAGGFKGLLSTISQTKMTCRLHNARPPHSFVEKLIEVRDILNKEIDELEKWQ